MSKFKIKGAQLLSMASDPTNMHQVHLRSGVSWKTVHKYLAGEPLNSIDADIILAILINGLGLTWDQIKELKFGDIFEITN